MRRHAHTLTELNGFGARDPFSGQPGRGPDIRVVVPRLC